MIDTGTLAINGQVWPLKFDEASSRSEAVHVNLMGYAPGAPQKFAYLFHWLGDGGSLGLAPYKGQPFRLVDTQSGTTVLTGAVAFRKPSTQQETAQLADSPSGNFLAAEVYECDFSAVTRPGQYQIVVEGVGSSFPFRIAADIYREAFRTTVRGLYHNRSGIELAAPHTEFPRPAPHNPALTPGFTNKLFYTSVRMT
jgi:endoglucanase